MRLIRTNKWRAVTAAVGFAACLVLGQSGTIWASTGGYPISDVLGQTDLSNNPRLTSSDPNNNRSPIDGTSLFYPDGVALDSVHHRLFVADCNNNRVLVYNLDSTNNLIDHVADNVLGQGAMDGASWSANTATSLNCPQGISYDSVDNRLFVPEWEGDRISVFDFTNGLHDGMAASHVLGLATLTTAPPSCPAVNAHSMCDMWSQTAYDPVHHWLFVPEISYHRIAIYDFSNGITDNMDASHVIGQASLNVDAGKQLTRDGISWAPDLAYDGVHERLFVGDIGDTGSINRILEYDLSHGITDGMDADHVFGQTDFGTGGAHLDQASVAPYALAYDSTNDRLFAVDSDNARIMIYDTTSITDNEDAVALLGQPDFGSTTASCDINGHSICDAELGMVYDSTNNRLIVTDSNNNRVDFYDFVHIKAPAGALPDAAKGASYSQPLGIEHEQGTVTFAVTSGTLPPGLSLNTSTGVISGTPTTYGAYTFEVAATDVTPDFGTFLHDPQYTITVPVPASPNTGFASSNWLPTLVLLGVAGTAMLALAVQRRSR